MILFEDAALLPLVVSAGDAFSPRYALCFAIKISDADMI